MKSEKIFHVPDVLGGLSVINMRIEFYENGEFFPNAIEFLNKHYKEGFSVDFFPKTGLVIMEDNIPVLIMPIYFENTSSVIVAGHCIFNDICALKVKHKAFHLIPNALKTVAKSFGKKYILTLWGRNSLSNIASKYGFLNTDIVQEQIYIGE